MTLCDFCGAPFATEFAGFQRCGDCSSKSVVDAPQVKLVARDVVRFLAQELGVIVSMKLRVELSSLEAMRRSMPGTPELIRGVTRYSRVGTEPAESCTVLLRLGMPRSEFGAVLAHELIHVAVAERAGDEVNSGVEEGIAEYVAWSYLTRPAGNARDRKVAVRMVERQGDVYGVGFRNVRRAVKRVGFPALFTAVLSRQYRLVTRGEMGRPVTSQPIPSNSGTLTTTKYVSRLAGFDEAVILLYAKGMTTGHIVNHLADVYRDVVSRDLASEVTDQILTDMVYWRSRRLNPG